MSAGPVEPAGQTGVGIAAEPLITVDILGVPVALQSGAQQHNDELTRELVLVAEQMRQAGDSGGLPARFVELVTALNTQYSAFTDEQEQQLVAAARSGTATIDLTYRVPASAAAAAEALGQVLDEVDDYCRAGRLLLTLATPAALVTFRRWFLDEFVGQAAGRAPVPWDRYAATASTQ